MRKLDLSQVFRPTPSDLVRENRTLRSLLKWAQRYSECEDRATMVAGACATATHGSGDKNGNLATAVSALELVTDAIPALLRLNQLRAQLAPLLLISEIRTIAQDKLWMSPCYKQPSVAIHLTWKPDWPALKRLLPIIEEQLLPFNAHWGKLFTMSPTRLQSLYQKLPDFQKLLQDYDPHGKFRNAFLETYL